MKCPVCKDRQHVDIDSADGYSQDIRECGSCGALWTFSGNERIVLRGTAEECYTSSVEIPATISEHTRFSSNEDEYVAEEARVWFS